MHYEWNNATGNLTSRTDNAKGLTETFTYDNLDRLTSWQATGNPLYETHYATNGNITSKSDIATGNLEYDPVKLHAVIKVNTPLTAISFNTQNITYTGFNKVETISEEDLANNVRHELHFTYGPDRYRRKTVMKDIDMLTGNETVIYTRYYDGNYEKEVSAAGTKEFYYISGPTGIIAVYVVTNGVGQLYYTLTGHLGSIVALMNESGNIVEETNYDPWGRVRNPNDWTYANAQPLSLIFRGFTGHEMLPEFGLINMNGRLYDPALGRFLSPDNFVQDPNNPQNYNRYAYCLNNPLKYVDPDGDNPLLIAAAIMGTINLISNILNGNVTTFGSGVAYFAVGAIAGALSATLVLPYPTWGFGPGFVTGFATGFPAGFVSGVGNNLVSNQGNALNEGLKEGLISGLIGGVTNGISSGIRAQRQGLDFWEGGEKAEVYRSYFSSYTKGDNCAYNTLTGTSFSYGEYSFDYEYWQTLNGGKPVVTSTELKDLINKSGYFNSEEINFNRYNGTSFENFIKKLSELRFCKEYKQLHKLNMWLRLFFFKKTYKIFV